MKTKSEILFDITTRDIDDILQDYEPISKEKKQEVYETIKLKYCAMSDWAYAIHNIIYDLGIEERDLDEREGE